MGGLIEEGLIMDLTPGEMLFYVGIAGMAVVAVISIIVSAIFSRSRKHIRRNLSEEDRDEIKSV